ncbi:MAG: C4-type zinc ribbon domain-containing protein [Opitutales bacterium]|jgi:predicted  nucleic acid-binding Zn-ribbon protein
MLSSDPDFQQLLLLHSRDRRLKTLKNDLEKLPGELEYMDKKIFEEKESIRMAMEEWKTLESKNNSLEKDILSHRDQIARQRNRQLEVKKNEEYQALEHEIANLESKIDELESEQIETLDKIDDARETAEVAEKKIAQRVIELEKEREERVAFGKQAEIDVQSLETQIVETREEVEPDFLSVYDRVSKIVSRPPYMAPLEDQKCSGCHLRVSNDVVSSVLVEKKLTQCDQCGRIVYIER